MLIRDLLARQILKVFDLLNKQKRLRVLEDGNNKVQVVGLTEKVEICGGIQTKHSRK